MGPLLVPIFEFCRSRFFTRGGSTESVVTGWFEKKTSYTFLGGCLGAFRVGVTRGLITIGSFWYARGSIASECCEDASGHMMLAGM